MRVINEQPIDKKNRIYKAYLILGPGEWYTHEVIPTLKIPHQVYITLIDPELEPNLYWTSTLSSLSFYNRGDKEISFSVVAAPAIIRSDIKITKDNWRQFYFSDMDYKRHLP